MGLGGRGEGFSCMIDLWILVGWGFWTDLCGISYIMCDDSMRLSGFFVYTKMEGFLNCPLANVIRKQFVIPPGKILLQKDKKYITPYTTSWVYIPKRKCYP